jgi:hypothetical protein
MTYFQVASLKRSCDGWVDVSSFRREIFWEENYGSPFCFITQESYKVIEAQSKINPRNYCSTNGRIEEDNLYEEALALYGLPNILVFLLMILWSSHSIKVKFMVSLVKTVRLNRTYEFPYGLFRPDAGRYSYGVKKLPFTGHPKP